MPYLSRSDLAEKDRDILARDINLFRALANSPDAARAFSKLGGFIRHKSRLDPRLRELAILQIDVEPDYQTCLDQFPLPAG